jgi:hypothetical protein
MISGTVTGAMLIGQNGLFYPAERDRGNTQVTCDIILGDGFVDVGLLLPDSRWAAHSDPAPQPRPRPSHPARYIGIKRSGS